MNAIVDALRRGGAWLDDRRGGNNAITRALTGADRAVNAGVRRYAGPQGYEAFSRAGQALEMMSPVQDYAGAIEGSSQVINAPTLKGKATGLMDMASNTASALMPGNVEDLAALGMFLGVGAKNANKAALATAEDMTRRGLGRDEIWKETGWFKGADGKWRFEIDDSARKVDIPGAAKRRDDEAFLEASTFEDAAIIKNRAEKRGISVEEALGQFKNEMGREPSEQAVALVRSPISGARLAERAQTVWPIDPYAQPFRVGDVVDHQPLFDNYPDMPRTELDVGNDISAGFKAAYDSDNDRFLLQKYMDRDPDFSVGHEIQHRIQSKEGFAKGGNDATTVFDQVVPLEKKIDALAKRGAWDGFDKWRNSAPIRKKGWSHRETIRNYIAQHPEDEVFKELAALDEEKTRLLTQGGKDYRRLAGEVEARNVQTRRDMTPEQRRATPPWETQDVPDDQQIVRFGDGSALSLGTEAKKAFNALSDAEKDQLRRWLEGENIIPAAAY